MPIRLRIALACFLAAAATLAAGCGSDDAEEAPSEPRPTETAERVGHLPDGWETLTNDAQGFAIGVPPGWGEGKACGSDAPRPSTGTTLLCSPDRLVTLGISIDRTNEALAVTPEEAAPRTAEAISQRSFEGTLEVGEPRPVKGRYDGASVTAAGQASGGRSQLEVYTLRREGIAAITAVVGANSGKAAGEDMRLAEKAIRSLRTKPVG